MAKHPSTSSSDFQNTGSLGKLRMGEDFINRCGDCRDRTWHLLANISQLLSNAPLIFNLSS
jgi:hypothetical protein